MALICNLLFCHNSLKTNFNFNLPVFPSLSVQSWFDYERGGGSGGRDDVCGSMRVGSRVAGGNGRQHTWAVLSICL